ncbi:MAG: response regulator [Gammaproteobacteria bacterium]
MTSIPPFAILLVDDDDVAAEAVVRGLAKNAMHCPIAIAEDGSAALQILRGTHPTVRIVKPYLVLLDLNMPRMNGFEFLRELRKDKELRNTVVFVLTTSGSDAERASAYEENIAGYIMKSCVGPQLSGLARFLIEYRSAVLLP